jgi:UDP-glucose 4-epimerase
LKVLVTGGTGFIGSHTCVELIRRGHEVVIIDNYSNSSQGALSAIRRVSGGEVSFYQADLRDNIALRQIFEGNRIDAVIHFAAKKSVRESSRIPLDYYENNVSGTINLAGAMIRSGVKNLVFSGSCSVYGGGRGEPIAEDYAGSPTNPYARSKGMCEQVLRDSCERWPELSVISLRYFNPVGAHPSGDLGEDPKGIPGNILPYMTQVAIGRLDRLQVYGDDWPTPDGSAVRDYVHVMDIAEAHCVALEHIGDETGMRAFNLGTGHGVSVFGLIAAFESASGATVAYEVTGRQPGDVASLIADPGLIESKWGWRTSRDLHSMCADAWHFQVRHPKGYDELRRYQARLASSVIRARRGNSIASFSNRYRLPGSRARRLHGSPRS